VLKPKDKSKSLIGIFKVPVKELVTLVACEQATVPVSEMSSTQVFQEPYVSATFDFEATPHFAFLIMLRVSIVGAFSWSSSVTSKASSSVTFSEISSSVTSKASSSVTFSEISSSVTSKLLPL